MPPPPGLFMFLWVVKLGKEECMTGTVCGSFAENTCFLILCTKMFVVFFGLEIQEFLPEGKKQNHHHPTNKQTNKKPHTPATTTTTRPKQEFLQNKIFFGFVLTSGQPW